MSKLLRVCLYTTEPKSAKKLAAAIEELNFVRVAATATNSDELATALRAGVNLIFFRLDPTPDTVLEVIEQVATRHREVAMIAISRQTNPQAILAPMRAGCDQFVCDPIDPQELAAAVSLVSSKRLLHQPKSQCICVTSASGGAGATSIASNLAMEIGRVTERPCALVDLCLQFGDLALYFDAEPRFGLQDLAVAGTELDESVLDSALQTLSCNVSLLAGSEHIDHTAEINPEAVHRVIEMLKGTHENVVVDVPRDLSPCSHTALGLADKILVVCQLLVPSIRNAKRYHDTLLQAGIPPGTIEVVVNRDDNRSRRVSVKDIEDMIRKPVYARIPNDYQFVARSIDFGRPMATSDEKSPVRTAIRDFAKLLTTHSSGESDAGQRRGLFGRLRAK